jgi:hypothetical protein
MQKEWHSATKPLKKKCYGVLILNIPDQLRNRVAVRGRGRSVILCPPRPHPPFLQQAFGQIFKDDGNGFSSTADFLLHETVPPEAFKVNKMITGRSCITYIGEV